MSKGIPKPDSLDIDLSSLPKEQQQSLEVAERARERRGRLPSFAGDLFMGSFNPRLIYPFPANNFKEEQEVKDYIDNLGKFLKDNLDPELVDETRHIPDHVVQGLKERKAFALKIPKEYGGAGFSQVAYNKIMMMVASYCASTAVLLSAHQSIGVPQPLKLFGTEQQKKKFFPMFAQGAISAFALTEEDVGSDPAKMQTRAILSEDKTYYTLTGKKLWCTNGPIADVIVVMANSAAQGEKPEISAFIVEKTMPGITVEHRCDFMGIRGIQNGLLSFNHVRVPVENRLWDEGRGLALALITLNTGRLTVPAACTGVAKQCLQIARKWSKERVQWGKAIGAHECGEHKLAWMASTTYAMEAMTWLTSHMADDGLLDIRIEAAMAKLFCSESAWQITDYLMQIRGGRGYEKSRSLRERGEEPHPCERILRDMRINRIIEGTSEIMCLFLAREALDPHLSAVNPLLKKGTPLVQKANTVLKLLKKYSKWYPSTFFQSSCYQFDGPKELVPFFNYIETTSRKLSRTLFHSMVKYGKHLEKKQLILNHIVEIGTDLFAMAATLSYTEKLSREGHYKDHLLVCQHFCALAQQRIHHHFKAIKCPKKLHHSKLAHSILEGKIEWLEKGIL